MRIGEALVEESARRSLPSVPLEPLLDRDPRELGAFRLLGRLGSGGMGVAYLADGQGQWAVVKVVRSELAEDAAFRARLSRELDAIGRLDGQSARVLESSLDSSTPWFAMEFIPGQTLDHVVRDRGPLNGPELSRFALSLARLLDGIHSAGIVHRDVKPSNVMMSPDGPRLIDFGIADVDEGTQLTRTGSVLGSLGWLSPEQVRGDATSAATDVHAWGLCVVFAATGAAPFGSDTSAAALYRVLETTPDVPTSMPEPLRGLVVRALAKDSTTRPTVKQLTAGLSEPVMPAGAASAVATKGTASTETDRGLPNPSASSPSGSSGGAVRATWPVRGRTRAAASPKLRWLRLAISGVAVVGVLVGIVFVLAGRATPSVSIGNIGPGGGVVFYDAGSQKEWGRYLEAAPAGWSGSDVDPREAWCGRDQPGFVNDVQTTEGIGAGARNTAVILEACGMNSAAGIATAYDGGDKNDWFLPSKDQLKALYDAKEVVGGLAGGFFWSSSQVSDGLGTVWTIALNNGYQSGRYKEQANRVRPIRAF